VVVNGTVYGVGTGHSKQTAAKAAAHSALLALGLVDE
jgi:dsRNA-specific ribonuclease